jgi:hypothetical protein
MMPNGVGGECAFPTDPCNTAACPGGGGALAMTMSVLHVGSHLLVGDGFARHVGTSVG